MARQSIDSIEHNTTCIVGVRRGKVFGAMADDIKKNYFTTGQMRNALIQIEDQMVHSNWMPNIILGINRGGCIPGVYLSHRLNTAHEVLDIRLRDHSTKPNLTTLART